MSKYNEQIINGSKWTRCHKIEITNRLEGIKKATFYEQEAIVVSNTEIVYKNINTDINSQSPIDVVFNANTTIDVVDPASLVPTGQTFTHGELYVMLLSAYMDAARKRDTNN